MDLNILFITFDQWRGDCWSGGGHPAVQTPNIDRFADQSTVFTQHFTQATPCGPARASIHTGRYAYNHGSITNGTPLDNRHRNWAQILRAHGMDPVLFGYTDTSADPRGLTPDDPRLKTYEGVLPGLRPELLLVDDLTPWRDHLRAQGYGEHAVARPYDGPLGEAAPFGAADSETAYVTDRFLGWLDQQGPTPWCAHLSYIKPHPPFVAAAPYHEIVDPARIPNPVRRPSPKDEAARHPYIAACLDKELAQSEQRRLGVAHGDLTARTVRKLRQVYLGLIAELDHHLGRIIDHLAQSNLDDRTLIILTSDHGEMLGDHWMIGKTACFEPAFHVPMMIRHPGQTETNARRVDAVTGHVDIVPTLLEAVGIDPPLQCDGRSLLPWLNGSPPSWRDGILIEHHFGDVQTGHFERALNLPFDQCQFNIWLTPDDATVIFNNLPNLMFDRRSDPGWTQNIYEVEPARAQDRILALLNHRMSHRDHTLSKSKLTPKGVTGAFDDLT